MLNHNLIVYNWHIDIKNTLKLQSLLPTQSTSIQLPNSCSFNAGDVADMENRQMITSYIVSKLGSGEFDMK